MRHVDVCGSAGRLEVTNDGARRRVDARVCTPMRYVVEEWAPRRLEARIGNKRRKLASGGEIRRPDADGGRRRPMTADLGANKCRWMAGCGSRHMKSLEGGMLCKKALEYAQRRSAMR
jgi:hypothetical protein